MNDLPCLKPAVPLLGVVRWLVQFCSLSFFRIVCTSDTRGIWSLALWNCCLSQTSVWQYYGTVSIMVWILFSMKHLLNIASSHLLALGPIFFSCSTKTSSLPEAFLSLVMPLHSCTLPKKVYHGSSFCCWGQYRRATWFALTRHGWLDVVRSYDSFLIVFHTLRLLCAILVNVMTYSHLFSSSFCQSVCFQIIWFRIKRVVFNGCSCMLHIDFLFGQFDWERILFDILLVCAF